MKDLNEYIEELLYKHQCVIIPKFGAFISNRKSARLFEDKTFAPPKRELTFNASLHSNDGLLIKYISETSGVEYNLVEDYVNLSVEGWKKILQQGETLVLNNIGSLRQTPEGRLSFEVFEDVNYLTDSFGMSAFVPHEIAEASDLNLPDDKIIPTLDVPVEQEIKTEKTFAAKQLRKEETKSARRSPFLAYTAIAVVGLVLLTVGAFKFFGEPITESSSEDITVTESQIEERVQQKLSQATFFQSVPLPAISLEVEKVKVLSKSKIENSQPATPQRTEQNVVKEEKKEVAPKEVITEKVTKNTVAPTKVETPARASSSTKNKKYQVIAGAFKDEKNAHTRVAQLKKLGFEKASVIGTNAKGLYQVSYAGFDNLSEAEAFKKQVKDQKEAKKLDGGWILTND